jgi:hypothetical protein
MMYVLSQGKVMASTNHWLIVQTLSTRWTKKSRGAPAAVRRNETPQRFGLNVARLPESEVAWHDVEFGEPHFLPMERYRERTLPAEFRRIALRVEQGELLALLFGSTRFRLRLGQSGIVVYNHTEDIQLDGWRDTEFQKVVLHVAFGIAPSHDLFQRAPDQSFVSLRNFA